MCSSLESVPRVVSVSYWIDSGPRIHQEAAADTECHCTTIATKVTEIRLTEGGTNGYWITHHIVRVIEKVLRNQAVFLLIFSGLARGEQDFHLICKK